VQSPFVFTDIHYGDPAGTAVRAETDFCPVKPRSEVLLDAFAIAPQGRRAESVEVALVGPSLNKRAIVFGERRWVSTGTGPVASRPVPFETLPLAWHLAYGGVDKTSGDPSRMPSDPRNPIGRGYLEATDERAIEGTPLPSVEDAFSRVHNVRDRPEPVGFGPVSRFCAARARWAGTYDRDWIDNELPFLPGDFDDRYFQAAPDDQQGIPIVQGTGFLCVNMSSSGRFVVRLPALSVPVAFFWDDRVERTTLTPDTLTLIPHRSSVVLVGRTSVRLPRKFVRLREVRVGLQRPISSASKPRYPDLGAAIAALSRQRR
jgi:hypothetical protein